LSAWCSIEPGEAIALGVVWLFAVVLQVAPRLTAAAGAIAAGALGSVLAARAAEPPAVRCFLPPVERAAKVWIEARIEDAATRVDGGVRVRATARTASPESVPVCGDVILTLQAPPFVPRAGERLRLHATLRRPRNFANPRSYDQAGALARRG